MMLFPILDLSIAFVNELVDRPPKSGFVSSWSVTKSKPGVIEFIVYRNRFPTYDTLGELLKRLTASLGSEPHLGYVTGSTQGYCWQFNATRAVSIEHRKGKGTFIQLTDTAKS